MACAALACRNDKGVTEGAQPRSSLGCGEETPLLGGAVGRPPAGCGPSVGSKRLPSTVGRIMKAALIGLMHIVCSAGLILFNKYMMHRDRFPFAVCLTTLHMLVAFVLASLLRLAAPSLFPSAGALFEVGGAAGVRKPSPMAQLFNLWPFLPVGACCATSVVSANSAYQYASVSFLQMVKESVVLWVYLLGVLVGLERFQLCHLAVLGFVTCSAALAVCSELDFRWLGLLLQLLSSLTQALQAVIMNHLMTRGRGLKVDPLSMVLGSSPVVLALLLPSSCMLWDSAVISRFLLWWPVLAANALAAFALQVVNAVTIRELSATGLALAAVLKDLAIVASAAAVLHERLAPAQVAGFAGAVCGVALYSALRLRPATAPAAPAAPLEAAASAA